MIEDSLDKAVGMCRHISAFEKRDKRGSIETNHFRQRRPRATLSHGAPQHSVTLDG